MSTVEDSSVKVLEKNLNELFLLVMGIFVFFLQVGFAFLEAGSVRSKNTTNILLKNVLDVFIGGLAFWLFGYAFAYGGEGNAFIGHSYFALSHIPGGIYARWFFQFVFAATSSTIVSGAMAERTEFSSYMVYSVFLTGFIYPVAAHWAWDSNGWLAVGTTFTANNVTHTVTYMDFAGSSVVHMLGGGCALVGAILVGPRIGRFDMSGKPVQIQGHTVPMSALGGFILFFGFFAFNGGSQGRIASKGDSEIVAQAIVNTIISGGGGAITAMAIKRMGFIEKKWSLLNTINGGLTGMVAICAGANVYKPYCALVVGILAGLTYILWSWVVLRIRIDDPLDAVAVHFGGGFWGILAAPLMAYDEGVFYKWDRLAFTKFGWNMGGMLAIMVWTMTCAFIMFGLMRLCKQLRVDRDIELKGLDIPKHGEPAYPLASYGDGWTNQVLGGMTISQSYIERLNENSLASYGDGWSNQVPGATTISSSYIGSLHEAGTATRSYQGHTNHGHTNYGHTNYGHTNNGHTNHFKLNDYV